MELIYYKEIIKHNEIMSTIYKERNQNHLSVICIANSRLNAGIGIPFEKGALFFRVFPVLLLPVGKFKEYQTGQPRFPVTKFITRVISVVFRETIFV